ncbi:MAG: DUF5668 domain-containing protein [Chloroflexi bacterium]|nr:DUF5668 domain-containing protein [Chloroflexota bacterium]
MNEHHHRRGGLVWPVILIGAGIVFLLNNLGMLSWSIWDTLFRLWPVLLIAVGLDILIGRRSAWGSLIVATLLLAALAAAIWLGVPQWGRVASGPLTTESISEPLNGATSADVEIGFGAGGLNLQALDETAGLIEGQVMLSPGEHLDRQYNKSGDVAHYELKSRGLTTVWPGQAWDEQKVWNLGLNRDVPIRLTIGAGVGRSNFDLSGLSVTSLDLTGGVGQVTLTLPQRGRLDAKIQGGIGEVIVIVPRGVAARIRTEGGLGGVTVNGSFSQSGNTYTSPGFSSAENRADLKVEGGIGHVIVREGE